MTIGETCVVLVAKSGGPLRYSAEFERRPGGAESTVAVGVARLGHSAGWVSKLGDDEFGKYVLNVMRGEQVDTSCVSITSSSQTGVFFRENRASGPSTVYYYRKNSAFSTIAPEDLNEDYISSAKILHLTGITPGLSRSARETVERAVEIAVANGVQIVLDFHVVGNEADRHNNNILHALFGKLREIIAHVRFQPRLRWRPTAALINKSPRTVSCVLTD